MVKFFVAMLALAFSFNAQTLGQSTTVFEVLAQVQLPAVQDQAEQLGLDWKVGDRAEYTVDMGFLKGSIIMSVTSIGADGIWMTQDIDLGFAGKQKAETLIDPNTGEIKKMLVNGKEQQIPDQDIEVVEMKEDNITVPAGTFDCIHARLLDKKQNAEVNAWLNPAVIPMSGMIKQVAPSQFGNVTVLLKAFKKQ